jgi:hypothetical protein
MTTKPRKPLLVNLTWAGALALVIAPVVYVLSYAPVVRSLVEADLAREDRGISLGIPESIINIPGYAPIEWLIDETPLRYPLLRWCGIFGIEEDARYASAFRPVD